MRRHTLLSILTFLLLPTLASAQQGVTPRLSWDHCAGDGYVGDRSFACNTNTGSETLWLSMVITDGTPRVGVLGFSGQVDFRLTSGVLPAWWQVTAGTCRYNSITLLAGAPIVSGACDPWFGVGAPDPLGVSGLYPGLEGSNSLRMSLAAALPQGNTVTLAPGTEYQLARIQITHAKSTGTGACTGCTVPACIGFGELDLQYPEPTPIERYKGGLGSTVTWQGGYVTSFTPVPPHYDEFGWHGTYSANLQCSTGPVPAQNRTWGSIKSMYH